MPTPAITLCPWRAENAARMAQLVSHPAVHRTLPVSLPTPFRVEHALGFIAACNTAQQMQERAIVLGGEIIGTVGATLQGHGALLGYWLGQAYWRQGIMSNALPLFIRELPPRTTRLRAECFDFNTASIALLRRCGFCQNPAATTRQLARDEQLHPVLRFERAR